MGGGGRSGRDQRGLAPAVVAVVVTCNPGPWLEETLSALRRQDYPSLSVLVIDAASEDDPTSRVAAVFPTAYVRRLLSNHGFAASANRALGLVQGASHLLICHDD
ncbi:MAG: glycosyltransferase family 2 protein, partial [Acidimicrobiales bacterium]|nr:glycosyltransferase family 2 protein [Acidimicrobiales bacterium]